MRASSLMVASTPILLAAMGELVVERSGVLNLGVEGMMIVGAISGFIMAVESGSPALGFVSAAIAAALLALLFGFLTQVLLSNQVATGLGLTLFGLGVSSLMGQGYTGIRPPPSPRMQFFGLNELPVVGRILFNQHPMVYLSLLLVVGVWWYLRSTRSGLILRAVGESHDAAHALGYSRHAVCSHCIRRRLRGTGRRVPEPCDRAAVDRGHDGRARVDSFGHRRIRKLARVGCPAWRLSFRRSDRVAA